MGLIRKGAGTVKPEIGQDVYIVNIFKRDGGDGIKKGVLKTIGRKYYTVTVGCCEDKFDMDDLRYVTHYVRDRILFFTEQDAHDAIEKMQLETDIRRHVSKIWWLEDLSFDQMRRIKAILDERSENQDERPN